MQSTQKLLLIHGGNFLRWAPVAGEGPGLLTLLHAQGQLTLQHGHFLPALIHQEDGVLSMEGGQCIGPESHIGTLGTVDQRLAGVPGFQLQVEQILQKPFAAEGGYQLKQ